MSECDVQITRHSDELAGLQQAVQKAEAEAQGAEILRTEKDSQVERLEFKTTKLKRELEEAQGQYAEILAERNGWQARAEIAEKLLADERSIKEAEKKILIAEVQRLTAIRAAAEPVREWLETATHDGRRAFPEMIRTLLAAICGKPEEGR